MPEWSDKKILKNLERCRNKALRALISQNYKAIYKLALYLTKDEHQAEEITQDTFVAAWETIDGFNAGASLRTWLHRIAYNKFIDNKRRLIKTDNIYRDIQANPGTDNPGSPLDNILADENRNIIYNAMKMLNEPDYIVIVLHYIQGLKYRQIANILNEPVGTIKWRTAKALKKLKSFLINKV